ncbi:uncharacterized protein LOC111398334 [Olea europaea var. sylvestris]|uniref:uncharacterized protein LOC111398334 n=1 Tax=Olea europaea var. sylvestris TaxID=158386 RepID=UPI000C1CE97C|nr:uncharacterized protein LOC111398334 [Olea europaea var. sylvestris]
MGIEHWAQSHFPGRQYNVMTSNNAESLNALFKKDREQFQLESFPCTYTVTVAMHRGFSPHILCSAYYITDYWRAAYMETIFPVPNEVEWEVPDHILPLNNLLPPTVGPCTPGRTRMSRIPSIGEFFQPRKCGSCGATGHTRRYCTSQIPLHDSVTEV